MDSIKNIAVLMTCHNRKNKTVMCLESLYGADLPHGYALSVFLVDDGSIDGTAEAVRTQFSDVTIIQGDGNLFWNRGMCLAWETASQKASYDYYLWLNDDVELHDNSMVDLIMGGELYQDAIICGAMCSRDSGHFTYGAEDSAYKHIEPNGEFQKCGGSFNGNLVLIPKSVFKKIGMLDKIFPHAIGDYEYAQRALKANVSVYLVPQFSGICECHGELPQWCSSDVKLVKRIKFLYSPLGYAHPYYFFIYDRRYNGLYSAIKHFFSIHLRLFIPRLWERSQ